MNLRGLNVSLLSLLDSLVAKDPFLDLSRTLSDLAAGYETKRAELVGKTGSSKSQATPSTSTTKPPPKALAPPTPSSASAAAPEPPKAPVFASTGGFSFGGKKVEASADDKPAAASPFGGFPSSGGGGGGFTFGGSKPVAASAEPSKKGESSTPAKSATGFSFGGASSTASASPANLAPGFSFSPAPAADKETPAKAAPGSSAGAFLSSILATPPAPAAAAPDKSTAAEAPKSGGLFGFSPSTSSSSSSAPAPFSFGSTTSPAAPVQPPSFNRLPSGTANFSFGGAPKRSVSSSSFDFGSGASSSTAPPLGAVAAPSAPPATDQEEDVPAPTIPSDPTLLEKGEGEEDEETHFEAKANIHKLGEDSKWSKVGTGIVKVKSGGGSGAKGRVLARVEGTGKLLIVSFLLTRGKRWSIDVSLPTCAELCRPRRPQAVHVERQVGLAGWLRGHGGPSVPDPGQGRDTGQGAHGRARGARRSNRGLSVALPPAIDGRDRCSLTYHASAKGVGETGASSWAASEQSRLCLRARRRKQRSR
jgi:hypothetical protein